MRIGVNATSINDRPSGARQRFIGLFTELVRQMPESEFVFFEPADCPIASRLGNAPNIQAVRTTLRSEHRLQRNVRGLGYWPRVLARERFDVFEALHMPIITAPGGKTILTIHDVRGLHPGADLADSLLYRAVLRRSLRAADHVVTVSEAIRAEILEFWPDAPVSVVYNGLDAGLFQPSAREELERVRMKFALPDRFLLAVGHFEPRKNYPALIDALGRLHRDGDRIPLVIVGNDSGEKTNVLRLIQEAGLESSVQILNGLDDDVLRCIYRLCTLFVFPSLYEGFGIPVLEAMAASRPMALSNIDVFREITQEQGVYFDPRDPESMAKRISNLLSSPATADRICGYGSERVLDFRFDKLAGCIRDLYHTISRKA